ncbi:MAG: InlB B-repeat-containing protein [Methanomassiliicoccaceae archaeon]|nr:InlB B-repeat-containing protein [Methanomassiliicoccaceae archaeon]
MSLKTTLSRISPKGMDPKILVVIVAAIAVVAIATVALLSSNNSSANEYNVSFPAEQVGYEIVYDEEPDALKTGEIFTFTITVDYSYDPSSLVVYKNGEILLPVDGIYSVTIESSNIKITVSVSGYSVVYSANGGSGDVAALKVQRLVGNPFIVASAAGLIAPFGMEFKEWNTHAYGLVGTAYLPDNEVKMPKGGLTLYAQWTAKSYPVVYDTNGGIGEVAAIAVDYGATFKVASADDLLFPGYLFNAWNTKADGSGDSYAVGSDVKLITEGMTLYAQWAYDPEQWVLVTFYKIVDEEDAIIYSADFLKGYVLSSEWNKTSVVPVENSDPLFMDVWYTTADRDVEWDMFQAIGDNEFELYLTVESQVERYLADKYIPKPVSAEVKAAILTVSVAIEGYEGELALFGHMSVVYNDETGEITMTPNGISMIEIGIGYFVYDDDLTSVTFIPKVIAAEEE